MAAVTDAPPYYEYEGLTWEAHPDISRKSLTLASGAGIVKPMTILGKITVSGKHVPLNLGAADGSQNAAAVLLKKTDATAADKLGLCSTRLTILNQAELVYPAGATAPQIAAINAQLDALTIVVVAGV